MDDGALEQEHKMRCREVFDAFDAGRKGWLAPAEVGKLVEHFLPGQATPGALKYLQVRCGARHTRHIRGGGGVGWGWVGGGWQRACVHGVRMCGRRAHHSAPVCKGRALCV